MATVNGSYMTIVVRCIDIITNNPGGSTWARLIERVEILAKANKREKVRVFNYLRTKSNIWNNGAADMSDTLFMLTSQVSDEMQAAATENSETKVSVASTAKRQRMQKYQSLASKTPVLAGDDNEPEVEAPVAPKPVVTTPIKEAAVSDNRKDIFDGNSFYNEDDVMAEMAWHVMMAGDNGLTLTALRMSVPEYSDSSDEDRVYLVNTMRSLYNVGFYERLLPAGSLSENRTVRVLALRAGARKNIVRSSWFIKQERELYTLNEKAAEAVLRPQVAQFGAVGNNAMADAFSQLKAITTFNANSGKEADEHDEEDNDDFMETEGTINTKPVEDETSKAPEPVVEPAKPTVTEQTLAFKHNTGPAPVVEPVAMTKPTEPVAEVSKSDVSQTADVLRLIASQIEANAAHSEQIAAKKTRFNHLMSEARKSSEAMQFALDKHNTILDELQKAADDLSAL